MKTSLEKMCLLLSKFFFLYLAKLMCCPILFPQIQDVVTRKMSESLSQLFPWMEYIVRVDWLPNGSG